MAGCEDMATARGLCVKHYRRWVKFGDPANAGSPIGRHLGPWDGRCVGCGRTDVKFYDGRRCVECMKPIRAAWKAAQGVEARRKYCRDYAAKQHKRRRAAVIAHYGGKCACCGESEVAFLAVDHKGGGGNAHRRSLSRSGKIVGSGKFYSWIVRNGYPDGFQLLCHNCNFAKSHGGCPHERNQLQ